MSQEDAGQVWPPQPSVSNASPLTGEAANVDGQSLEIQKCPACDNRHVGISLKSLTRPIQPFTHFFMCPAVGDPVPVSLAMLHSGEALDLRNDVCQALAEAQIAGRFVAAIFFVNHDGRLILRRITHKFPTGDYFEQGPDRKGCMGLLRESFESEAGVQQPVQMREAPAPKPLRAIFGDPLAPDQKTIQLPEGVKLNQASIGDAISNALDSGK